MLREGPQGSQPGLWGSLAVSATMPVPVGPLPTPGVPGELSARGVHPPARGWGSMVMGTMIHTWSCCVSGPQTDPTALWGRSGPRMSRPSHTAAGSSRVLEGSGWWAAGAAGLEMMEGLGGGDGAAALSRGVSAQPFFLLGTTAPGCSRVSALNQRSFPAPLFPSCPSRAPLPRSRRWVPASHRDSVAAPSQGRGTRGWAPPAPPLTHMAVAGRDRGAPCATAHLHPGHTAGTVSKDILTS